MEERDNTRPWLVALLFASGVVVLVIALYVYWFAIGDRYRVFLYDHDMGSNVPDTSPFSPVTGSRYWMTGLVAAGAVMILYLAVNWLLARLNSRYKAPAWWRVWALASPPLLVAIPWLTLTMNEPVLTVGYAAQSTFVCIIALALALSPGTMAAEHPVDLAWLASDGFGLMLILVTLPGIQFLDRWLERGQTVYVLMMVLGTIAGVIWLLFMSVLRIWRHHSYPSTGALLLAGFAVSYLLLPFFHHLAFTDGYYYISDSDNFFARNVLLQMFVWIVAAVVAVAVTRIRRYLTDSRLRPALDDS
ncbi:MAG: hypothetical protein WA996_16895 [Candidatus Promineifilaceae bacterium]